MSLQGIEFKHLKLDTNKLAADYLSGLEPAVKFYGGPPEFGARIGDIAEKVDNRLDRTRAAHVLQSQRCFESMEKGRALLDEFIEKEGFIVCTGQQPVLFGGPLFVLYKCVSVIATARACSEILGRPVLPVFWNASEDHDLVEASSVGLPDQANELRKIALPANSGNARPLCQTALGSNLDQARSLLEEILPETDFGDKIFSLLDDSYQNSRDFGHAFSSLLAGLFAGHGLFIVDACSPEIRRSAGVLFEREIFDSASSADLFERAGEKIEQAGYHLQVKSRPGDTALFVVRDGQRLKLERVDQGFALRGGEQVIEENALRRMLEQTPEIFSPGVRMRPLVEAELFGTLCYLAGPGEIAYYAQIKPLYELRGLAMPLVLPRLSGYLLESKIARVLDKFGIEAVRLERGADSAAGEILRRDDQWSGLTDEMERLRKSIGEGLDGLESKIRETDPTMKGPLKSTRSAISSSLDKLQGKLIQAAKKRNETMLSQLRKAEVHLWPDGNRQEREISWLYYLVRYGEELIDWLLEQAERSFSGR